MPPVPIYHPHLPPVIRGRRVVDVALPEPSDAPRCRLCGRVLRSEGSRAVGLGPRCARRLSGRTAARASPAAPTATPVPHIPRQTALPLQPFQPTLESL
ncbi:DUF6011 domain-containing protein [Streptomyces sp. NPDC058067]|uniref:DUF6011 domain-containing protein n=1 Tax=Streptomyces sp. NPDC058067 TaxID=3346324 RepID=UPI0036E9DE57